MAAHWLGLGGSAGAQRKDVRSFGDVCKQARLAKTAGDMEMAVALFSRARELAGDEGSNSRAEAEMADCLYELGKRGRADAVSDAIDVSSRLIADRPDEGYIPQAYLRLSECLLMQGETEAASHVLARASRFLGRRALTVEFRLDLGRRKLDIGDYEGAAGIFGQITSDHPSSEEARQAALLAAHARAGAAGLLPGAFAAEACEAHSGGVRR